MKDERRRRQVARTVLIVGEGDAEVMFLQHLKKLYVQRGSGVVITIKNARGKGAGHVVDFAMRQSRNAAYDLVAAVLDADADWNERTRAMARKGKVRVSPCQPCLEAVLLDIHGAPVLNRLTAQLKQDFQIRFCAPAHDPVAWRHFKQDSCDAARPRVRVLDVLVHVLVRAEWID